MITEINSFDTFVDDLLESDEHILKGELDLLLMQYLFNSIELENIQYLVPEEFTYIAAQKLLKYFYNKFWYPVFGKLLLKFVYLIEGKDKEDLELNKIKKDLTIK